MGTPAQTPDPLTRTLSTCGTGRQTARTPTVQIVVLGLVTVDKRAQETIQAVQAFAKDRKAIEEIEAVIGVLGPILFPIFREGLGLKRMEARIEAIHKLVEAIQEGLENVDGPATGIPDDTSKPPG